MTINQLLALAESVCQIIPTFDPNNGDMILVIKRKESASRAYYRLSPEMGAEFRSLIFQAIREKAN
jgi:hypothetical protein